MGISSTYLEFFDFADTGKISVKLIQKGGPQHIVPAFFVLSVDYNPNAAPEIFICLNKVGKARAYKVGITVISDRLKASDTEVYGFFNQ